MSDTKVDKEAEGNAYLGCLLLCIITLALGVGLIIIAGIKAFNMPGG